VKSVGGALLIRWWKQHLSDKLVGLDLGPESIKLLRINVTKTSCRVENFFIVQIPPGTTKDKDLSGLVVILDNLFKRERIDTTQVALAIPRSAVIIKTTVIDSRFSSGEIESRIWIEANRHFPDLVGEIYLDYNLVGPNIDNPKQLDVALVACRKDQVKPYLELTRQANLTAKVVDVNCYALERALNVVLEGSPQTEIVALLNLDVALSSLIVVENHDLIFAHDQAYNGRRLRNEVDEYLGNEARVPTDSTVQKGSLQDAVYLSLLKDNLSIHMRHSMHFFYSSRPSTVIDKIVLAGDLATLPNIAAFVQQEFSVPTMLANPFAKMEFAPAVDELELQRYAPALMLCCGLALSKLKHSVDITKSETTGNKNGSI
jgi:type IV pilus assembly protein PilM